MSGHHLLYVRLQWAVKWSGLHMFWYQSHFPQDVKGQSLLDGTKVMFGYVFVLWGEKKTEGKVQRRWAREEDEEGGKWSERWVNTGGKRNQHNIEEQSLTSGGEEKRSEREREIGNILGTIVTKCKEAPPLGQFAATV